MVWVNFLPWRRQRLCQQLRHDGLLLAGLLAILTLAAMPLAEQQAFSERQQIGLHGLKETNGRLEKLKSRLIRLEQQRDALRRTLAVNEARQERLRAWDRLMHGLADTLPAALWLSEITKTAESLSIAGFCLQLAEVEAFRKQLQPLALFQQVKTARLSRDAQGVIRFSLAITLAAQAGTRD